MGPRQEPESLKHGCREQDGDEKAGRFHDVQMLRSHLDAVWITIYPKSFGKTRE